MPHYATNVRAQNEESYSINPPDDYHRYVHVLLQFDATCVLATPTNYVAMRRHLHQCL